MVVLCTAVIHSVIKFALSRKIVSMISKTRGSTVVTLKYFARMSRKRLFLFLVAILIIRKCIVMSHNEATWT